MNQPIVLQSDLIDSLPGLDCGQCGSRSCEQFAAAVAKKPDLLERCVHRNTVDASVARDTAPDQPVTCQGCESFAAEAPVTYRDSMGREFDFILDALPGDPGPREVILPRNPVRTAQLDVKKGDLLIGRPLGMSCGCPITHCGIAMEVDPVNGVISWCVTGPLGPRSSGYKDLGYYSAEAYEGLVSAQRTELAIGMRYWFMPHRCMLQWRHSALVNFINRGPQGLQVRLEGLFIG